MLRRISAVLVCGLVFVAATDSSSAQSRIVRTRHGSGAGDLLGTWVAGVGDINGDGFADVGAGAPNHAANGADAGLLRVWSGIDGAGLWAIPGGDAGDLFGTCVAGVGDVDRDGRPDVCVGAPGDENTGGAAAGTATVYSGRTRAVLYRFEGDGAGDEFGFAVAGAGDVNGDGWPDVIVGARFDDDNGLDSGTVSIYSGRDGSRLHRLLGDAFDDHFGHSVAGLGDVDGDGRSDVVVGAPFDDNVASKSGMARVYSGATGAILWTFDGTGLGHEFGTCVSSMGDLDGDGRADILVSAPEDKTFGDDSGSVWVFSGADGSTLQTWYGDSAYEYFGHTVAAGDVDGDRVPDVIVGTPYEDRTGANSGRITVFSGATRLEIFASDGTASWDRLGHSVAFIGDVNGDVVGDFAAGAPWSDFAASDAGAVRLYCGAPTPGLSTFGTGCPAAQPLTLTVSGTPLFGNALTVQLANGSGDVPGAALFGFFDAEPFPLDLTGLGMPGCAQYHSYDIPVGVSLVNGATQLGFFVPPNPVMCGFVVFVQGAAIDPTANALGVALSNAGRAAVAY